MNDFLNIFGKERGIVIGVVHFPPLAGYADAPPMEVALKNALADLEAFEHGGADAIIIENNYDLPHTMHVGRGTIDAMIELGTVIRKHTKLPMGVCVLWNDDAASFEVAKAIGAQFIRVPVFVDDVRTDFGDAHGDPASVLARRKKLHAENIHILPDIHVKHAEILSKKSLGQSAKESINAHAAGVIVTGKWTGHPPSKEDLSETRAAVGTAPIFAGSGVDARNISDILQHANGVIVSTSLKEGSADAAERNVKSWMRRIDTAKVRELVDAISTPPTF